MKRILACLLALLLGTAACAERYSAYDLALEMAKAIPEMTDIREAPLEDASDRVIWTDARTDERCDLILYADASEAEQAAVREGTRYTSARVVDRCLLGIDSDLSMQIIDEYQNCLAEILGVEPDAQMPDFILNVNTKKFHKPDCSSVDQMKETNRQDYSGDREYLLDQGYDACKKCKP